MPRGDYEKFKQIAIDELGERFFFQSEETDPHWGRMYSKIRINQTIFLEEASVNYQSHQGIFMDIWPFDFCGPVNGLKGKLFKKFVSFVNGYFAVRVEGVPLDWKHMIINWIVPDCFFIKTREKWKNGKGNFYINYSGRYGAIKESMPVDYFEPPSEVAFEGKMYLAPGKLDDYLTHLYGADYMQLPPIEKRETHNPIRISFDTSKADEILTD